MLSILKSEIWELDDIQSIGVLFAILIVLIIFSCQLKDKVSVFASDSKFLEFTAES